MFFFAFNLYVQVHMCAENISFWIHMFISVLVWFCLCIPPKLASTSVVLYTFRIITWLVIGMHVGFCSRNSLTLNEKWNWLRIVITVYVLCLYVRGYWFFTRRPTMMMITWISWTYYTNIVSVITQLTFRNQLLRM